MKNQNSILHPAILLVGLVGFAKGQVTITANNDAYISNDSNSGPTANHGTRTGMEIRRSETSRMRAVIASFDISDISGDLSGAYVSLTFTDINRDRNVVLYGAVDGDANETWDETNVTWATAPIVEQTAPLASFVLDAGATPILTQFNTAGLYAIEPVTIDFPVSTLFDDFAAADTNGVISILVTQGGSDGSQYFFLNSREGGSGPTITFPNASAGDSDSDGLADLWEDQNFGNNDGTADAAELALYDGTGNPDGDAFDNEAEETAGSDPNDDLSIPGDIDGDGLTDLWEDANFGNNDGTATIAELGLQDANGDPDGDFGFNDEEEAAATDPQDFFSFLDEDNGGSGDGLNDWWELFYFFDTATATDPSGDNDGDLVTNDAEYLAGSDPSDLGSVPGDVDADTLDDAWETQYFGNITTTDLPGDDPDLDTFTNKQENDALPIASDPTNINSVPDDSDADGLSDTWEIANFSDTTTQNGNDDSDDDLYTNEEEETAGTDPNNLESFVDSEPDGLNDRWEIANFGDLTTVSNPAGNSDGDAFTDYQEYLGGSDPNNANSVPNDIDGDGLADDFELTYFGDIYSFDGDDDPDGDYATNEEEESNPPFITNPIVRTDSPDNDGLDNFGDFLGDAWEIFSFGSTDITDDPGERDGTDPTIIISGDPDNDGYINSEEYAAGTNGNDPLSTPDTDGDGLPEGWERFYFAGDETTQTGADDSDNDGQSNFIEFLAGTDPSSDASVPAPGILTTASGSGADTNLSNDEQNATTGPNVINGEDPELQIRNNQISRLHVPMLRFDTSLVAGDLTNAVLQIHIPWQIGLGGNILVYGLVDGSPGEDWDEATTNYLNAPGIIEAQRNVINFWSRDPQQVVLLGSIAPTALGSYTSNPQDLNLTRFLEADTDGLVTLFLDSNQTSRWHGITAKEQGTNPAPAILLPLGAVTAPADLLIDDITVDATGDTFTLTVTGLTTGAQYHLEQLLPGETIFSTVAGSTFTATGDPHTEVQSATLATTPTRLVRVVEGAE